MFLSPLAAKVGLALLKASPHLVRASVEIYEKVKKRKRPQPSQGTADADTIPMLRTAVEDIQQRLETQEASTESQAELIVQLTRHNAALARWLFYMGMGLALSSGVAVAALILTLLD